MAKFYRESFQQFAEFKQRKLSKIALQMEAEDKSCCAEGSECKRCNSFSLEF